MNPLFPPPVKQIRLDIPGFMKISKVSRKKCLPRPRIPAGRRLRESRARASLSFLPPLPRVVGPGILGAPRCAGGRCPRKIS